MPASILHGINTGMPQQPQQFAKPAEKYVEGILMGQKIKQLREKEKLEKKKQRDLQDYRRVQESNEKSRLETENSKLTLQMNKFLSNLHPPRPFSNEITGESGMNEWNPATKSYETRILKKGPSAAEKRELEETKYTTPQKLDDFRDEYRLERRRIESPAGSWQEGEFMLTTDKKKRADYHNAMRELNAKYDAKHFALTGERSLLYREPPDVGALSREYFNKVIAGEKAGKFRKNGEIKKSRRGKQRKLIEANMIPFTEIGVKKPPLTEEVIGMILALPYVNGDTSKVRGVATSMGFSLE